MQIQAMLVADWVAYIFCAVIVTLVMTGELKDVTLCRFAAEIAGAAASCLARGGVDARISAAVGVFGNFDGNCCVLVIFSGAGAVNVASAQLQSCSCGCLSRLLLLFANLVVC